MATKVQRWKSLLDAAFNADVSNAKLDKAATAGASYCGKASEYASATNEEKAEIGLAWIRFIIRNTVVSYEGGPAEATARAAVKTQTDIDYPAVTP